MDVPGLLRQAASMLPAAAPRDDVAEYLAQDEWEPAFDVLLDLGDEHPASTVFWRVLEEAAHRMRLVRSAAWCAWRRREVLHGVIRAELRLVPGARRAAIPGDGRFRSLWDTGLRTPTGRPAFVVARIWVEYALDLPPGAHRSVRLAPVTAARWDHLSPGDPITLHEHRLVTGAATVTEARFPVPRHRR